MTENPGQTRSPASNGRGVKKSMPVAAASASLVKPTKLQKAAPSEAVIAQKAYEIWFSQGQQPGRDQENWFEAEQQLQHA